MGNVVNESELYMALSDMFVDKPTDYEYMASVAKKFPIDYVELSLFKYVAPACYYNVRCPVPPVCYFFDERDLLNKINKIKNKENSFIGKVNLFIFSSYLRIRFHKEWVAFKNLL